VVNRRSKMKVLVIAAVFLLLLAVIFVGVRSRRESSNPYVGIVSQLPRPTPEQTRRFAEHVAQAKNWYKLIPAAPEVPFVFYLDPDAGRHWIRKTSGMNLKLSPETDLSVLEEAETVFEDSVRAHQYQRGWETTEEYLDFFGLWNFYAPNTLEYEILMENGDIIVTAGPGFKIRSDSGWCEIPRELEGAGTAFVSSLVYPFAEHYPHFADGLIFVRAEPSGEINPLLRNILELQALRRKVFEDNPDAEFDAWQKTENFQLLGKRIEAPLMQERKRLIQEMVSAMERFLEKLDVLNQK
jgi:hypothetical protein